VYEPWFNRNAAEDLTALSHSAVKTVLAKVDGICIDHLARQSESFGLNVARGLRVAVSHDDYGRVEWYFSDYQIYREYYLLVIGVSGPFNRIP
jgi:hypothetical protein